MEIFLGMIENIQIDGIELAVNFLAEGKPVLLIVRGFSMQPLIPDKTKVVLEPINFNQLQRGDIVLSLDKFEGENKIFLMHRVTLLSQITQGDVWLQTRGDAVFYPDTIIPAKPERVLGKVTGVTIQGKYHNYKSKKWHGFNKLIGWVSAKQIEKLNLNSSNLKYYRVKNIQNLLERKFFSFVFILLKQIGNHLD